MTDQHEKSIQYYERAMQLSPLYPGAFVACAGISVPYFFLGRYEQALHWLEWAFREKLRFAPARLFQIAALAMDDSHPDELRALVQQVKSMYPGVFIRGSMQRLVDSRFADRELFETALRKAGFPE